MNCQITPQELLFCIKEDDQKYELISAMSLDSGDDQPNQNFLKPFVSDFTVEELWSNSEVALLRTFINNKKYRKRL